MLRIDRLLTLLLVAALSLVCASSALAVQMEPDVIEDPPIAQEPVVDPDVTVGEDDGGEVEVLDGTVAEADAIALPSPPLQIAASPTSAPAGQLPFTGIDAELLTMLALIASVIVAGGTTAWLAGHPAYKN